MPRKKLTDRTVKALKAPAKGTVDYADETMSMFGVRVRAATSRHMEGRKQFYAMYRYNGDLRRWIFRPDYPHLKLGDARDLAGDIFQKVNAGIDPKAEAEARRKAAAEAEDNQPETYEAAVEDFIERYHKGRKNNKYWKEPRRLLLAVGKEWKGDPLGSVTKKAIREALEAIMASGKGYAANRTYAALLTFYNWCEERDSVDVSPMRGLARPFDGETRRKRVFSNDELKAIWTAADQIETYPGALVKLAILTGKRRGALMNMKWADIDADGYWTPPMDPRRSRGTKRVHPLTFPPLARRILSGLDRVKGNSYVFPGRVRERPMYWGSALDNSMREKSGVEDFGLHPTRHSVETGMARIGIAPHLRDLALDHAPNRGAGAGYDHYDYKKEVAGVFKKWANEAERIVSAENVAVLR